MTGYYAAMEILDKWPKFNPNHVRNTSPYVWSSAALETLPVCVFMFPVTARTRVEYTFSFTSASKNIFLENMIDCLTW